MILYGAPASGKDTVTREIAKRDSAFRLFRRIKVGAGRTSGYRISSHAELARLREANQVIWENSRYGADYAIDRPGLVAMLDDGLIPVVHAGQTAVIDALRDAMPDTRWTVVQLQCSRSTAERRIIDRGTGDTAERLAAWDSTPVLDEADCTIDTDITSAEDAADMIRALARR
ncbi:MULTISPECIES: phosphotransferase-like protein [Nocardia]|uniref:phosphotransferase-like protein n=1 Tax=Nocardia TaxID=1817 RepID=UPI001F2ED9D6|nr:MULTISPECIES: AAA family ATPase [Nocardia]